MSNLVICDLDDFAQDQESNALNWFIDFRHKYPQFKVTLFTIIGRWNVSALRDIKKFDWIEYAAHGFTHFKNDEVYDWNKKDWYEVLNKYEETGLFTKIFKAPNWQMTPLGYHVLKDMGWAVACRKEQIQELPTGMKYYCFETNFFAMHGHTWTMRAHVEEGAFNRWGKDTEFDFVSNHLEEKI